MTWLVQYRTTVSQLVAAGWRLDIKGPVVGLLLLDRRHETWPPLPAKGLTTRRRAGKPLPWFITRITQTGTNHRDKGLCVFVSVSQRWCCCCPHQHSTFLLLDHFWKVLLIALGPEKQTVSEFWITFIAFSSHFVYISCKIFSHTEKLELSPSSVTESVSH